MIERIAEASPRFKPRVAGVFEMLEGMTSAFGQVFVLGRLIDRILGVLLAIDGLGWMAFVVPPFALHLIPFIAAASALAEIPLQLWLVGMGVNPQR